MFLWELGGAENGLRLKICKNLNIFEFWHENISLQVRQKYKKLYMS